MPDLLPPHLDNIACHLYAVFTDHMPSCGCGRPGDGYKLIHGLLRIANRGDGDRDRQYEALCGSPGATQIILAALDHAELISHASLIGYASIADRGRWILWAVEQVGGIDAVEDCLDRAGFPHEWDREKQQMEECTDSCWQIPAEAQA